MSSPSAEAVKLRCMTRMGRYLVPVGFVTILVAVAIMMLYEVWQSPDRNGLATFWQLAVAVAVALVSLFAWVVRRSWHPAAIDAARLADLADDLAAQVKDQWTRAALDRGLIQHEPIPVRWRAPKAALA